MVCYTKASREAYWLLLCKPALLEWHVPTRPAANKLDILLSPCTVIAGNILHSITAVLVSLLGTLCNSFPPPCILSLSRAGGLSCFRYIGAQYAFYSLLTHGRHRASTGGGLGLHTIFTMLSFLRWKPPLEVLHRVLTHYARNMFIVFVIVILCDTRLHTDTLCLLYIVTIYIFKDHLCHAGIQRAQSPCLLNTFT